MPAGSLDSNGVWMYGEDDSRDTFSELLNIGQDSISDAIGADRARLSALEAAGAVSGVFSGVAVAASGWSFSTATGRKKNGLAFVSFSFTRTGAAVTVPADGNIGNQVVGNFAAGWVPLSGVDFTMAARDTGPLAAGYLSAGNLILSAVAPGFVLGTGAALSLAGVYILA